MQFLPLKDKPGGVATAPWLKSGQGSIGDPVLSGLFQLASSHPPGSFWGFLFPLAPVLLCLCLPLPVDKLSLGDPAGFRLGTQKEN